METFREHNVMYHGNNFRNAVASILKGSLASTIWHTQLICKTNLCSCYSISLCVCVSWNISSYKLARHLQSQIAS